MTENLTDMGLNCAIAAVEGIKEEHAKVLSKQITENDRVIECSLSTTEQIINSMEKSSTMIGYNNAMETVLKTLKKMKSK